MEIEKASSDILRREILEQSKTEAEGILEQAKKEEERLIQQGQKEADAIRSKALKVAQDQVNTIKKKILSNVYLEVKKQQLKTREEIFSRILNDVQEKLEKFRNSPDYKSFLTSSLIEAVLALKTETVQLQVGNIEKALLEKGLIQEVAQVIQQGEKRTVELHLMQESLDDGGVIAISKDGRTRYDNSFSAQLKRQEDAMRLMVVKDVLL